MRPDIFVIETVAPGACWREAERHAIAYFRSLGCSLTNNALGGDGVGSFDSATRSKMSRSAYNRDPRSRVFSTEGRKHMTVAKLKQSLATREKLALAGRSISEETRQKRRTAAANTSALTRRRMSLAARNKASLTVAQVREIRALVAAGELSLAAISRHFEVSASVVSRIKAGKTWTAVPA